MSNTKYKMFRNFMVNELGITREDIKEWCKEAIAEQVLKLYGQVNLEEQAAVSLRRHFQAWSESEWFRTQLTKEIMSHFKVTIKEKTGPDLSNEYQLAWESLKLAGTNSFWQEHMREIEERFGIKSQETKT